jgi:hypothetical protein
MNIRNILNGWHNFLSKSEVSERLASDRAMECIGCPHAKKGLLTVFIKDDFEEIQGYYCNLCKCPISAKIRSKKEKCDIDKW